VRVRIKVGQQLLQVVLYFLLCLARDLPADPSASGLIAQGDGPDVPVLCDVEVDRILAVPAASGVGSRHDGEPTPFGSPFGSPTIASRLQKASDLVGDTGIEPVTSSV